MLTAIPSGYFRIVSSSARNSARNLHVRHVRSGFCCPCPNCLATITPTGIGFKSGEYATHFSTIIAPTAVAGRAALLALLGCVQSHNKPAIDTPAEEKFRFINWLTIYLSTECATSGRCRRSTETNPLYWLRAMDCADRLMPAQSRQRSPPI